MQQTENSERFLAFQSPLKCFIGGRSASRVPARGMETRKGVEQKEEAKLIRTEQKSALQSRARTADGDAHAATSLLGEHSQRDYAKAMEAWALCLAQLFPKYAAEREGLRILPDSSRWLLLPPGAATS